MAGARPGDTCEGCQPRTLLLAMSPRQRESSSSCVLSLVSAGQERSMPVPRPCWSDVTTRAARASHAGERSSDVTNPCASSSSSSSFVGISCGRCGDWSGTVGDVAHRSQIDRSMGLLPGASMAAFSTQIIHLLFASKRILHSDRTTSRPPSSSETSDSVALLLFDYRQAMEFRWTVLGHLDYDRTGPVLDEESHEYQTNELP
ncbi:hypothetical protein MPTK2_3g19620 [Marchantia polymorpha subsp. ruderalis]